MKKNDQKTKVLVLGASGMLGHKILEVLSKNPRYDVYGTLRTRLSPLEDIVGKDKLLEAGVSEDKNEIIDKVLEIKPDIVINCIGITKQKKDQQGLASMIFINALLPYQIAKACTEVGAKFIQISTDCVFDGQKGEAYMNDEKPTCHDAYGMTKYLGEITDNNHLTLRTSIIGHELETNVSLLDWFLYQQEKEVKGFKRAIFSGFTTLELAKVLGKKIIPQRKKLNGLYQISVNPIDKNSLLTIVKDVYHKKVTISPDEEVQINRALDSSKIRSSIDYKVPSWETLIEDMHKDFESSPLYNFKRKEYEKINK